MSVPSPSASEKTMLLCPWSSVGTSGGFAGAGICGSGGRSTAGVPDAAELPAPCAAAACCRAFIVEERSSNPDMPLSRPDALERSAVTGDCPENREVAAETAELLRGESGEPAARPPKARLRRFMPVICDDGPR